jgi:hypothetical protein
MVAIGSICANASFLVDSHPCRQFVDNSDRMLRLYSSQLSWTLNPNGIMGTRLCALPVLDADDADCRCG